VQRFGIFGSSMGGAVALMAAARDERVVALATLAAVAHPEAVEERYAAAVASWRQRGWFETEAGRIGAGFVEDAVQHNLLAAVRVLHAPLLVLHGDRDEVVPCSDAHDIAAAARNVSLEIVMGADHRFSDPVHLRPAMDRVADFLAGHLQSGLVSPANDA
jgi:pimeloyl-ACP methyl ester carboxylesterase